MTRKTKASLRAGFSLVEVVLAVGVISFAFVAIMGLIPAGLTQFRQAMDTSVGSQIAQRVIFDAEQTDFDTLVDYTNTRSRRSRSDILFSRPFVSRFASRLLDEPRRLHPLFHGRGQRNHPGGPREQSQLQPSQQNRTRIDAVYYVNTRITTSTVLPQPTSATTTGSFDLATVLVQIAFNPGHRNAIPVDRHWVPLTWPGCPACRCATIARRSGATSKASLCTHLPPRVRLSRWSR